MMRMGHRLALIAAAMAMSSLTAAEAELKRLGLPSIAVLRRNGRHDKPQIEKVRSRYMPHQGAREGARRRRQLAAA